MTQCQPFPTCFGSPDLSPACRGCKVRAACHEKQATAQVFLLPEPHAVDVRERAAAGAFVPFDHRKVYGAP